MNSRERVRCALNHKQPDRMPIDLGGIVTSFTYGSYQKYCKYLNIEHPKAQIGGFKVMVDTDEEILEKYHVDFRNVFFSPDNVKWQFKVQQDGSIYDFWGIKHRDVGDYYEMIDQPLKDAEVEDLDKFPWPDFTNKDDYKGLKEKAKAIHDNTEFAVVGTCAVNVLERAEWLRGIQNFLVDLYANEDFALALMERTTQLAIDFLDKYLDEVGEYLDVICIGDDLAMQNSLMFSPEVYRKMIKPFHRKVYNFIKKKSKAKIFHHSCGAVVPLLGDLIDIGLDIINPAQPAAKGMDFAKIKENFGRDLTFWGAIDEQNILPFGSDEEIVYNVKKAIKILGKDGGYVLAPAHNIQSDVRPEKLMLMVETALNYNGID
jgi:uroporphyrinogen decarboxylase